MEQKSILGFGPSPNHAKHPTTDPERLKEVLLQVGQQIRDAGFDFRAVHAGPEDGVAPLVNALKEKHTDGVLFGFALRGSVDAEMSIWFEDLVNAVKDVSPSTKILFNWDPPSTLPTVQRVLNKTT